MKESISGRQTTFLALGAILGTVFMPIAQMLALDTGRDGWMLVIPSFFAAFPFVYAALYVYLKYPGQNLLQSGKLVLGRWLAYPLIFFFFLTSLGFSSLLIRQGTEIFVSNLMRETPSWVFTLGTTCLVIAIGYLGIEVFARFNEFWVLSILLSIVILIMFSIPKAEVGFLKPYLYNGFKPFLKGSAAINPFGFEYILFLWVLLPFVNKPHEVIRSSARGYLLVSVLLTGIVVIQYQVFGPEETARLFYGAFSLARQAEVGKIFHGLESFFVTLWFGAGLIKTGAFFFCTYYAFRAIFPLQHSFWLVTGLGLLMGALSYLPPDNIQMVQYLAILDKFIILPLGCLGTSLLAIITFIRDRKKQ